MANRSAKRVTKAETAALERDNAETYDRFKEFEGRHNTDYSTSLTGLKFKLAHKRADKKR